MPGYQGPRVSVGPMPPILVNSDWDFLPGPWACPYGLISVKFCMPQEQEEYVGTAAGKGGGRYPPLNQAPGCCWPCPQFSTLPLCLAYANHC